MNAFLPFNPEQRRGLRRWLQCAALAATTATLAACGGGGDDDDKQVPVPPPTPAPAPQGLGELLHAERLAGGASITPRVISAALAEDHSKVPEVAPRYSVSTWRLTYLTEDKDGTLVRASGLVALPDKGANAASPVIGYQHATTFQNDNAPSRKLEPAEPPIVLASLGYIVVAPDYVGFGESNARTHPYLQAHPTARAVLDMLTAAQTWRRQNAVADTGQLYLVGYSEGGYATMAAQREMERSGHPLLAQLQASVPGAGPYDVQATLDGLLQRVQDERPEIAWLLKPGTLRHLGSSLRAEVRRLLMRALLPGDADVDYDGRFIDLYLADRQDELKEFSSVHWGWTPTAPVYLFHGRQDQTVPFAAGLSAYDTLAATRGAPVSLQECVRTQPSGHLQCVPEYFTYAIDVMQRTSRGL
ncbi:Prolyl oligopeptidase family protein [Oryzisolibacter propanilivorax]|uniref:Prolyl oligopeptidase family protein n=1 Tax=Oryzisolibacter propanilivorax TaxID=1527607 RepID=A0A1G9TJI9_9BURK|nr:alpha/beta fold hydrolase [Oryzisolibacter propanilivorax]SDM47718.1 Prolyl oligopeptidase family protein [Oryzisolibacter propanilivorax]